MVRWCGGAVVRWCDGAVVRWCGGAIVRRRGSTPTQQLNESSAVGGASSTVGSNGARAWQRRQGLDNQINDHVLAIERPFEKIRDQYTKLYEDDQNLAKATADIQGLERNAADSSIVSPPTKQEPPHSPPSCLSPSCALWRRLDSPCAAPRTPTPHRLRRVCARARCWCVAPCAADHVPPPGAAAVGRACAGVHWLPLAVSGL